MPVKVSRAAAWFSATRVSPVTTSTFTPTRASATMSRSSACVTPSAASTATRSTWPGPLRNAWAVRASNSVTDVPAGLSAVPNVTMPTSVASWTPLWVWNVTVSPSA
jgi:hypothetical protein